MAYKPKILAVADGGTGITTSPITIALGGTNATTMGTSTGIVKFDGTSLVTSTAAKIDSSNRQTNTSQPAFLANLTSSDLNATGDNTIYTLGGTTALTEIFDQDSNFNTNGTFTAPITGKYVLCTCILVTGGTSITSGNVVIVTSNRSYQQNYAPVGGTQFCPMVCVFADMDVGDTATSTIKTFDSGGKIDDIFGDANNRTYFSGYLAC